MIEMKYRRHPIAAMGVSFMIAMVIAASITSCRHNTANTANPKVALTVTLLDASNATVTIMDGLTAADKVLDNLRASEPEYYAHVRPLLVRIAKANDVASIAVVKAKNGDTTGDWKGAVAAVAEAVSASDLTIFGFKNSNTQLTVQDGFAILIGGLTLAARFESVNGGGK